jgi:hypothetical protein
VSFSTQTRYLALVGALAGERRAAQTAGYPLDPEKMLPVADVVLLIVDDDPGAMLYRYTAHGELAGDTWHASAEEAREQAAEEYGTALVPWVEIPQDIEDAHGYAVKYAADRMNDRGKW